MFEVILHPQEESTNSQFSGQLYLTNNFLYTFGEDGFVIAAIALDKIKKERVPTGADYLQVLEYEGTRFWLIDDGDHITALLPEDY